MHSDTKKALGTRILSWGSSLPSLKITNDRFCSFLETSDEWITERVGINTRYICSAGESTVTLARDASLQALEKAHLHPEQIDLVIVATETPDQSLPCAAVRTAQALQIKNALAFDVRVACSGFIVALATAEALLERLDGKNALVIGAESLSRIIDWRDRNTAVLFGDGAGACILSRQSGIETSCIKAAFLKTFAEGADFIQRPGEAFPENTCPLVDRPRNPATTYVEMNGREVFKKGVQVMTESILAVFEQSNTSAQDIALFVPHQSNIRMINAVCKNIGLNNSEVVATNIHKVGNTSAASIPLALAEYHNAGKVQRGNLILLTAVGSGITYGSLLIDF